MEKSPVRGQRRAARCSAARPAAARTRAKRAVRVGSSVGIAASDPGVGGGTPGPDVAVREGLAVGVGDVPDGETVGVAVAVAMAVGVAVAPAPVTMTTPFIAVPPGTLWTWQ
jgi:hypothetical protein